VPLIIRWPKNIPALKQIRAGTVDTRLLEAIDLAPTMLDFAGAKKPAKMEGEVFLGPRAGNPKRYVFGARDRCDETVFRFRTVRDERYRYIRNFTPDRPFLQPNKYKERSYPVWNLLKQLHDEGKLTPPQEFLCAATMPAEELYDCEVDPFEIHNLADSSEHQKILKRLRAVLEKWIADTHDQGATLEPPELAARDGITKPDANPQPEAPPKKPKRAKKK
jgi:arylsulfatase A-like enzyme